jgi:hypothetical protein
MFLRHSKILSPDSNKLFVLLQTLAEGNGEVLISDAPQSPISGDFYRLQGQVLPASSHFTLGNMKNMEIHPTLHQ